MKKALLFLFIASILVCSNQALAQKMPTTSDDIYTRFCKAVQLSSINDLEGVMCKASIIRMKNEALSMGMEYPKEVLDGLQMMLLEQKDLSYLNYKKNGVTTNVYYMYGKNKAESNIITMCLVEEGGVLKLEQFKMRDAKDFIINLNKKDYSFLDLKEFAPTGIAPEILKEVNKVDYLAGVDMVAYGYKLSVTVNGFFQGEITNTTRSGVLIGGVDRGANTIEIKVEKMDINEKDNPAVSVRAYINGVEKEVFVIYEPMNGTITKTFYVE